MFIVIGNYSINLLSFVAAMSSTLRASLALQNLAKLIPNVYELSSITVKRPFNDESREADEIEEGVRTAKKSRKEDTVSETDMAAKQTTEDQENVDPIAVEN